jgi:uroporphyrinogen III methyltransferase/synthase
MGENIGKVYLVGAGPGDPKLITVRGLEALRRADAVVYDRLAGPRLLKEIKPGADVIYVGKRSQRHEMKQEDINRLLVELASGGKTVVRLKGGDPCVFGRVGEEAEALAARGIPFEIIPGVTSAIGVPAYAGIPLTHRDLASSFAVVTGFENPDKPAMNVDWEKLAPSVDTLVFLMGVSKIDLICRELLAHGRPAETPAAVIRWGTRAAQRTLVGTLADIAEQVRKTGFKPPAVIVVGEVVRLRETMNWFERKPLFGRRVLITRSAGQSGELAGQIDELGGEPVEWPAITLREPEDPAKIAVLDAALARPETYDWVIFTSVNGVDFFFRRLRKLGIDIRRLAGAKVAAVGPKTAEALKEHGIVTDVCPDSEYQQEGLLDALLPHLAPGQHVLFPKGGLARDVLPETLASRGIRVTEAVVYENVPGGKEIAEVVQWLEKDGIHAITFTSSSTVHNLCDALENSTGRPAAELLKKTGIACIGPLTAEAAEKRGLPVTAVARKATIADLVQAAVEAASGRAQEDEGSPPGEIWTDG